MLEEKKSSLNLITGILFIVLALFSLNSSMSSIYWLFDFKNAELFYVNLINNDFFGLCFLTFISYIIISVFLIRKKINIILPLLFAIISYKIVSCLLLPFNPDTYSINVSYVSGTFSLIILLLSYISIIILFLANTVQSLENIKNNVNKVWFIPAILILISFLSYIILVTVLFKVYMRHVYIGLISLPGIFFIFYFLIFSILSAVSFLLLSYNIAYPNGVQRKTIRYNTITVDNNISSLSDTSVSIISEYAYCSMVKHVLLLIFTFGIWYLIWVYKTTGYLNAVNDEEPRNPTTKLLLCIFVPFYGIYWTYKSAQRIDKLSRQKGLSSDSAILCLIMAIFLPIIAPIIMQDKINNIITARNSTAVNQKSDINIGVASELKNYKELLDSGVITQEEFDKKKKQLLDL